MKLRTKKVAIGIIGLCLIIALTIGGTLAYLTRQTEIRVNNFTVMSSDEALNVMLTEPAWDGIDDYEYEVDEETGTKTLYPIFDYDGEGNAIYGYDENGDPVTDKAAAASATVDKKNADLGVNQAQDLTPYDTVAKDPTITNKGKMDAYVAAKMTFVYLSGDKKGEPLTTGVDGDLAKVLAIIDIDYDADKDSGAKWVRADGEDENALSQVFYYSDFLVKNDETQDGYEGVTVPLFNTITVSGDATNGQLDAVAEMGGFAIYIEGYAVQTDAVPEGETFETWAATNVTFENTPEVGDPADVEARYGVIVPA